MSTISLNQLLHSVADAGIELFRRSISTKRGDIAAWCEEIMSIVGEEGKFSYDPVARFHLGNGARLQRINWRGNFSPNGLQQSAGILVNYLYDRKVRKELQCCCNFFDYQVDPEVGRQPNCKPK